MSMNRPRGGLSRCALLAKCRFAIAVAAIRVAAPAKAVITGYRRKATRQSDRNDEERFCGKAMCNTSGGLHDASGNEKCWSYSRTGAVELSFLLSRTKLYVSEGLTVPSIQIASFALSACRERAEPSPA